MSIQAADALMGVFGFNRVTVMVWELKRGERFKVEGSNTVWEYRSMDGAYCYATDERGNILNWSGPVEKIEPASEMDDDNVRMAAIGQNGNDGAHYGELK